MLKKMLGIGPQEVSEQPFDRYSVSIQMHRLIDQFKQKIAADPLADVSIEKEIIGTLKGRYALELMKALILKAEPDRPSQTDELSLRMLSLILEWGIPASGLVPWVESGLEVSPLQTAITLKQWTMARALLEAGANPNDGCSKLDAPLGACSPLSEDKSERAWHRNQSVLMAERLIQKGADVNRQTAHTQPALISAIGVGRVELVRLLVNHGAKIHPADFPQQTHAFNQSPLVAVFDRVYQSFADDPNRQQADEMVAILLNAGVDPLEKLSRGLNIMEEMEVSGMNAHAGVKKCLAVIESFMEAKVLNGIIKTNAPGCSEKVKETETFVVERRKHGLNSI